MADIVGTLRAQAKIFDEMAEIHLRHHYEDMRQQGMKQAILANCFTSAADEIERLRDEVAEWRQVAQVEAGLRREFLARAEKAEAATLPTD